MKVIGITGPTGAGKTTALNALTSLGGCIIDADAVYHDLTVSSAEMQAELTARFGDVYQGNVLDRKKLGAIVFQDKKALEDLNTITHKYVDRETGRRIEEARAQGLPAAAIDAIALFEGGLAELCDITVAVTAPEAQRVQRLMARDGISEAYASSRIAAQHTEAWFRERCGYLLENDGTPEQFREKCLAFFRQSGIIAVQTQPNGGFSYDD